MPCVSARQNCDLQAIMTHESSFVHRRIEEASIIGTGPAVRFWKQIVRVVAIALLLWTVADIVHDYLYAASLSSNSTTSQSNPCDDSGGRCDCFCCCVHVYLTAHQNLTVSFVRFDIDPSVLPIPPDLVTDPPFHPPKAQLLLNIV